MIDLRVDKTKMICRKLISNAEILHRRNVNTNQTHIGLLQGSVRLEHTSIPSLLIYNNNSYDTLTIIDPIENPDGTIRSPKTRQGRTDNELIFNGVKYESTYQKINDLVKEQDDLSETQKKFFIIYGTLENRRLFFILYDDVAIPNIMYSLLASGNLTQNELFGLRSKGFPNSVLHEKYIDLCKEILLNYENEESVNESFELIKSNNSSTRYFTDDESRIIRKIGLKGEQLINNLLQNKKNKKEILDFYWLSKDFPSADHDFEITCLDKSVKMVEVKSTINEFENDFYWSKNERRLFLNNPNNYIFKRVSKVFQPEAVNVRSSNNLQQLRDSIQIPGVLFEGHAKIKPVLSPIEWGDKIFLKKYF